MLKLCFFSEPVFTHFLFMHILGPRLLVFRKQRGEMVEQGGSKEVSSEISRKEED